MKISLQNNKGFKWYKNNSVCFKGYFYMNNTFYQKEEALNLFHSIQKKEDFKVIIDKLNGSFTVILTLNDATFIYSDISRSFPIFYTKQNNDLFLSDDIYYLKSKFKIEDFGSLASIELKASNHTYGKRTLLKDVYQIQASELLEIKKNTITNNSIQYNYATQKISILNYKQLQKKALEAFKNSFNRFIKSLKNRPVAIPLSAGFDSRLIAVFLKKINYKNVICYTYGKEDSFEIENSKKVAHQLGFRWYFIEYNEKLIDNFLNSNSFKSYVEYAGKLSSMPNLQEYFAVKYLKEKNLIAENTIFVPGYAGDILGGSEYLKTIPNNPNPSSLADIIVEKKMMNYHFKKKEKKKIVTRTKKNLNFLVKDYKQLIPETVIDDFNIKERIAKYIFNSASFYTFFDYEFRFPFWDIELLDYFKEVPLQYKSNKLLFDEVLINKYFKPYNVYFEDNNQPKPQKFWLNKIKKHVKPFLPTFIKEKKVSDNDWNNYKIITEKMLIFLKKKDAKVIRTYNDYNEIISQWYIYISKNGFN